MASSTARLFSPRIVAHTGNKCTASVILLHGSGGTGEHLCTTFQVLLGGPLKFPHIRLIYPTAPVRPYTLARGMPSTVWFDRETLELENGEVTESVDSMATQLGQLIEEEITSGIPPHRILLGGMSMGGAMALHLGYRFHPQVAGVLTMCSFLNDDSRVYQHLKEDGGATRLPPLLQFHGEEDDLVLYDWGRTTHSKLTSLGVKGQFVSIPNLSHVMNASMAKSAREWMAEKLPEDSTL